jgi:hypothetical protein
MKAIIITATKAIEQYVQSADGHDMTGRVAVDAPADYATTLYTWDGSAFVVDLGALRAAALATIDDQREANQMRYLTVGGAKKWVYAQKAKEAADYGSLTTAAINLIGLVDRQKRWPFAMAEVSASGDTLAVVMARFQSGLSTSQAKVAAAEATAMVAKRAVAVASTRASIAAAANPTWPA